jgi:hypothetical protein
MFMDSATEEHEIAAACANCDKEENVEMKLRACAASSSSSTAEEIVKLLIALGTKRHARKEPMNCTRKLCLMSLREPKTAPSVLYLFQKHFHKDRLTFLAVGRISVSGVFLQMQNKILVTTEINLPILQSTAS